MGWMRGKAAVALVVAVAGLGACGGDDAGDAGEATTTTGTTIDLVGALEDGDTYIAIVADEDSATAYVCNGEEGEVATTSEWFTGVVTDGEIDLLSAGGARLRATITDGDADGTFVAADGTEQALSVEPAEGNAGMYRYEAEDVLAGFVVANDGSDRGGVGFAGTMTARARFDAGTRLAVDPTLGTMEFQRLSPG